MKTLSLNESSSVMGGDPSAKRCNRLLRRTARFESWGWGNSASRTQDTFNRICAGQGPGGSDIGSN
jgi:hypothetical protein